MDFLNLPLDTQLSLRDLILNLAIGSVLAFVLQWHFIRYAKTLTNRRVFAQIFVVIVLTTILIISVIKTSLALSLGLVGALSIVRFRTPIKSPEELAYLFLAIATGLGIGANQTLATSISVALILMVVALVREFKKDESVSDLFLSVTYSGSEQSDNVIKNVNAVLSDFADEVELKRADVDPTQTYLIYVIHSQLKKAPEELLQKIVETKQGVSVTLVDQHQTPVF